MHSVTFIFYFLIFSIIAGILGALAMNFFMRWMSSITDQKFDMIEALGTLITGSEEGASRVGNWAHLISGIFFGMIYTLLMVAIKPHGLPLSLFLGLGFGFIHGLIVSYLLMFYIAEKHPSEKYREATLPIGFIHMLGHVIYGLVVGLVVGLAPGITY